VIGELGRLGVYRVLSDRRLTCGLTFSTNEVYYAYTVNTFD